VACSLRGARWLSQRIEAAGDNAFRLHAPTDTAATSLMDPNKLSGQLCVLRIWIIAGGDGVVSVWQFTTA
jgi:hypothetical protein